VLLVAVFNVIGLLIYILVRPKQTLAEQYDRALEEEILLQELEQSPTCHNCGRPVKPDWQYCPYCEAELKHPCPQCGYLLEPEWKRCPQCGAPAGDFGLNQHTHDEVTSATQVVAPPPPPPLPDPESAIEAESEPEIVPPPVTTAIPEADAIARAETIKREKGWDG